MNFSVETLSHHFHCCCDGLSASNAMRQAGHTTLEAVALLRSISAQVRDPRAGKVTPQKTICLLRQRVSQQKIFACMQLFAKLAGG